MEDLLQKKCVPCERGLPPLSKEQITEYLEQVKGWKLSEGTTTKGKKHPELIRDFTFDDFMPAMQFVNKVAEVAEGEGHHPDIYIFYNKVRLSLWTHAIGGLHDNDFILAAKINAIL